MTAAAAAERPGTPQAAIHAKCAQCSGGSYKEIWYCPIVSCPLWDWRQKPPAPRKPKRGEQIRIMDLIREVSP